MRGLVLALLLCAVLVGGPAWAAPVDINHATPAELDTLPGIGPGKAQAIVDFRKRHGPFQTVEDLAKVSGIGPATVANLADRVVARPPQPGPPPEPDAPDAIASIAPGRALPDLAGPDVDVNQADVDTLQTLPGIGPTKAFAIVQDRDRRGPYSSCHDLVRVVGIGPATVANAGKRCVAQ